MSINIEQYGTPTEVANQLAVNRTTLLAAVDRGEIRYRRTLGGSLLIEVADAIRWTKLERKRGRKPNARSKAIKKPLARSKRRG